MTSLILATGAGAAMLVLHRKNGNGHAPEARQAQDSYAAQLSQLADSLTEAAQTMAHLPVRLEQSYRHLMEEHAKEPQVPPEWSARMLDDLERIEQRLVALRRPEETEELIKTLDEVPRRIEASFNWLIQAMAKVTDQYTKAPPPVWTLEITERLDQMIQANPTAGLQKTIEELPHRLGELFAAERRSLKAAGHSGGAAESTPPPPRERRNPPPDIRIPPPGALPATPSIPAPYVPGSVYVPAGQVFSLLVLIQDQLSPNCPGTSVELLLEAESDPILVGGASSLGGPLTATNYAYQLLPGVPRIYRSSYPGNNTPVGELQVLSATGGWLHVEVQT